MLMVEQFRTRAIVGYTFCSAVLHFLMWRTFYSRYRKYNLHLLILISTLICNSYLFLAIHKLLLLHLLTKFQQAYNWAHISQYVCTLIYTMGLKEESFIARLAKEIRFYLFSSPVVLYGTYDCNFQRSAFFILLKLLKMVFRF